MNDPDVYAIEYEQGHVNAIPWYFPVFQAADRCNCKPWELVDEAGERPTPRAFWYEAAIVVASAESAHAKFLREHAKNEPTGSPASKGAIG